MATCLYTEYTSMYTYARYIHCTYIDINTCTFIQSYKPINLYTHNAAEGTPGAGHAQVCAGKRHTWGCPEPCVQKTQAHSTSIRAWLYKFTSKLRHFHRAVQSRDWKWDKGSVRASAWPAPTFQGLEGTAPSLPLGIKANVRRWHFT